MRRLPRRLPLLPVLVAAAALLAAGCGGGQADPPPRTGTADTSAAPPPDPEPGGGDGGAATSGDRGAKGSKQEADAAPDPERIARPRVTRAYRAYLAAISARDGAAVCALIAPGFERELRPPVRRGDCARRITRSIGYADPRGFPVWEGTTLSGIEEVHPTGAGSARVTALIVTDFRDRAEPSIESDIAYLERGGDGSWRLAKASGALYRAVGKPDIPPGVIAPPN